MVYLSCSDHDVSRFESGAAYQTINTTMRLSDIIREAPLPGDWDKSAYTKEKSFASRLRYATARAKKLGTGSSRVAFEIEYQGRPTVLKIAKNKKGMAQNEYEIRVLRDWYVVDMGITIPMIDSDEIDEDNQTWLHTEKAEKMTPTVFKSHMGGMDDRELMVFIQWSIGSRDNPPHGMSIEEAWALLDDNETLYSLMNFAGSYDVHAGDLSSRNNWGLYNGSPVLIDVGLSSEIMKNYYS